MALMDGGDFFKLGTQQASRLFVNPSMGHEAIVQAGPQGTLSSGGQREEVELSLERA